LECAGNRDDTPSQANDSPADSTGMADQNAKGKSMKIQYLEIVTSDVDAVCETYSQLHDVTFGEGDQNLGGARTAKLANGGMLGVRAPMHDAENPVVRHYILVDDIKATVDAVAKSGAKVALPPMELAGHGTCAIVIQGGIEFGFWQL
jgi:predicted enzyme related to lactoylglutathione lyase